MGACTIAGVEACSAAFIRPCDPHTPKAPPYLRPGSKLKARRLCVESQVASCVS